MEFVEADGSIREWNDPDCILTVHVEESDQASKLSDDYLRKVTASREDMQPVNDPVKNDAKVGALAQTGDALGTVLGVAMCIAVFGLGSVFIASALRRRKYDQ